MSQSSRHVYWKPEGMSLSIRQSRTKFSRLKHSGITRAFCARTRWAKKIFSRSAAKYLAVDSSGGKEEKRPREMRARAISNLVSRRAMTTPPSPSILTLLTETRNSECSKRVPLDPCFVRDPNDFELRFKDSIFRPVAIRSPCK